MERKPKESGNCHEQGSELHLENYTFCHSQ